MKFTDRELEVIGHALNVLYEQVKEMYEEGSGDGEDDFGNGNRKREALSVSHL